MLQVEEIITIQYMMDFKDRNNTKHKPERLQLHDTMPNNVLNPTNNLSMHQNTVATQVMTMKMMRKLYNNLAYIEDER